MAEVDLGITKVNTEVSNSHFVTIHIVLVFNGASIITQSMESCLNTSGTVTLRAR